MNCANPHVPAIATRIGGMADSKAVWGRSATVHDGQQPNSVC